MDKKAFLIILDGWGIGENSDNNAIYMAQTPFMDQLLEEYPNATLITFGEEVGLPAGQMGNSEVGHLNLGAGRIVYQELLKINRAFAKKEYFDEDKEIQQLLKYSNENQKPIHIMGLVSDGGVHSHINHLIALTQYLETQTDQPIYIHAFTDGRDTDPHSGIGFMKQLMEAIDPQKTQIATVTGRYYAMDRDKRWERIALAYKAITKGEGEKSDDILASMQKSYDEGISDEFIKPIIHTLNGKGLPSIKDEDVLISFNFRTDRPREIIEALSQEDFTDQNMYHFDNLYLLTFTDYDASFENIHVLFDNENLNNTIGEILDDNDVTQLRIAETEKYPHVTYFFSGGREIPFEREVRIMEDSPRDVATYDLKPQMSAEAITQDVIKAINQSEPGFICLNFANTDMVGHTGVFEAAMTAAETADKCLSQIIPVALEHDYQVIILADHGNSDYMINPDGSPNTAHTKNPVPIILVNREKKHSIKDGKLADVAPTLLQLMGIDIPDEMTGEILIAEK